MIKEYKQKIWDFYPFRTELHTHTAPASPCSSFSARTLAEALTRQGIHAAVLTNHFGPYHMGLYKSKDEFLAEYLKAYHDLKREADALGLTAIFGIELRFHENKNDYLVLGIDENEISRVYDAVEGGLKHFRASFSEMPFIFSKSQALAKRISESVIAERRSFAFFSPMPSIFSSEECVSAFRFAPCEPL